MQRGNRNSAPKVRDGKVQRKNRRDLTHNYWSLEPDAIVIDKERPGDGHKHLLSKDDIRSFLRILPDWEELGKGLRAILLAQKEDTMGWYASEGVVAICPWEREIELVWNKWFMADHQTILQRLGVPIEAVKDGGDPAFHIRFTEHTARGFQLMHILLHELGHHHDRMTTKAQERMGRGESYAEDYSFKYADQIWDDYFDLFGY